MALLRYVSHPNVQIDPSVPVPLWGLSAEGHNRAIAMLGQPWVRSIGRVISSGETKALETATPLAAHLGVPVERRESAGETDRSSTGYVPHDRHEELANAFFAQPDVSAEGWEIARSAQARILTALADVVADGPTDVAVVGHGGVGTLLFCHLAGHPIDRQHDQIGGGHYWTFDRTTHQMLHSWRPIDESNS